MNYPMYNNQFYLQDLQNRREMLDNQIKQYQQQNQYQMQQPQAITQNFQLAPQTNNSDLESKFVENIDDVKKTFVIKTGIFVNKDFSNLWIKDASGNIRTFRTEEIIEMDEKDKEIYMLKKQIEEMKQSQMKGDVVNATQHIDTITNETTPNEKPPRVQHNKYSNAK